MCGVVVAAVGAGDRVVAGADQFDRVGVHEGQVIGCAERPQADFGRGRERGEGVAGEFLAAGGQGDGSVRGCAQERDAGGVFELADLAGESGVLDAQVPGGVLKAGMPGDGQQPADALLGARSFDTLAVGA